MLVLSICSWILDVAHQGKEAEVVVCPSNYCTFVPVHVLLPLPLCSSFCGLVRQYLGLIFMGLDDPFGIVGCLPSIEYVQEWKFKVQLHVSCYIPHGEEQIFPILPSFAPFCSSFFQ